MATGTEEFIDVTTADVFLDEIWSKMATISREANTVFARLVDRRLEPELTKGQIIHLGNISSLAAQSKTAGAAVTYETVTETASDLTVNQHYYAAFAVEDIIKVQASQPLLSRYTAKIGAALALQEDDSLAALVDAFSNTVGTLATDLTDDNIIRGDQYLNDANCPLDDRHIVVSPAQKAAFLKMDKFVHADYGRNNAIATGNIGNIYGYTVDVSTNVDGTNAAGHDNAMFHRESIAAVTQIQPKVMSAYDIDYLATKVVAQQLWGVLEIRDDHGCCMYGA